MVNTPDVVLVLREPRVQGVWDVGKQVVIENYEKDHPGGKAGAEARLEGNRERRGGEKGVGEDLPQGSNVLGEAWRMRRYSQFPPVRLDQSV